MLYDYLRKNPESHKLIFNDKIYVIYKIYYYLFVVYYYSLDDFFWWVLQGADILFLHAICWENLEQ